MGKLWEITVFFRKSMENTFFFSRKTYGKPAIFDLRQAAAPAPAEVACQVATPGSGGVMGYSQFSSVYKWIYRYKASI